ncbi:MAG: preprotein translocase subunit SecA, partial [Candidatus Puniceispirillaceae bacterium]
MFSSLAKSLFGEPGSKDVKRLQGKVDAINAAEPTYKAMSDDDLKQMTATLKGRHEAGESLDDLLVDAFAIVREAAVRALGQRHFDVQLMGGIALHEGRISEMKTGEGKTLAATLAVYLNALTGRGVHVVTVNDYLASRDAGWMGRVYEFLGLSVGCVIPGIEDDVRRAAYQADVTYGTNNEFGFDYLRDNLKFTLEDMVQRDHNFAIVDEVDSILIDEARTPLIISGPAETSQDLYKSANKLVTALRDDDFERDEKARSVTMTETGVQHAEQLLIEAGLMHDGSLYDIANVSMLHHMNQALRAHKMFQRDTHYMVKAGQVIIIDEFTGRAMEGRRYSDGLHQAIEAKENLQIQAENQTLASVTYQNYFRLYDKLAGMTGTAQTEAGEFSEIYNLSVVPIPTNLEVKRIDHDDEVYRTSKERDDAVIALITDCQSRGQPILVGTVTIEKSEALSEALKKKKIKHQVLNARFHEEEAKIIALAGVPGAVTIATNMAGRGTDIQLGGNLDMRIAHEATDSEGQVNAVKSSAIASEIDALKVKALAEGGLYVVGTERHESRRIDNQLRGRTGRQGDPGASKFFLSLEDDLMRIFGSEKLDGMLQKLGLEEGEAITHPWINKAVEKAQSKVEAHNFEIRKQLLRYDDVMNDQRHVIFSQRKEIMETPNVHETVRDMRHDSIDTIVAEAIPQNSFAEQWDAEKLKASSRATLGLDIPAEDWIAEDGIAEEEITERLQGLSDS